jgi:hypothetical protein
MGWIQHLSTCCQLRVSSYGHIPLWWAPKAAASWGWQCLSTAGSPRACLIGCPGLASSWGGRRDGQTGSEILHARSRRTVERWRRGSFPGFVLFRLVASPLQSAVAGPYSVWGVWFLVICHWREPVVSKILGRNRWATVPEVPDPDTNIKMK